jgi:hypothetical protein
MQIADKAKVTDLILEQISDGVRAEFLVGVIVLRRTVEYGPLDLTVLEGKCSCQLQI